MYQKIGNEIRSARGILIATLNGGVLTMAPGKKSQETKVREYLASDPEIAPASTIEETVSLQEIEPAHVPPPIEIGGQKVFVGDVPIEHVETWAEEKPQTSEEWQVSTIPESELPPFDAQLGINTPGFGEFVSKHKLNKEQVGALIKRICRMKGW